MYTPGDHLIGRRRLFHGLLRALRLHTRFYRRKVVAGMAVRATQSSTNDSRSTRECFVRDLRAAGGRVADVLLQGQQLSPSVERSGLVAITDLNGVLLERLANIPSTKEVRAKTKAVRDPDIRVNRRDVWLRPYYKEFLTYLHRRHSLAVWSSAAKHTVVDLVELVTKDVSVSSEKMLFMLDRSYCTPDPKSGRYMTTKELPKLWNDARYEKQCRPENTVIFDDTQSKVRSTPDSAIIIPEYTVENLKVDFIHDESLLWAALYLEHVASAMKTQSERGKGWDAREAIQALGSLDDFILRGQSVALEIGSSPSVHAFIPEHVVTFPQETATDDEGSAVSSGRSEDAANASSDNIAESLRDKLNVGKTG